MFETFNVAGLFIADEPVLSLYAHGKLTGCVIDFGHGKTGAQFGHPIARRVLARLPCRVPSHEVCASTESAAYRYAATSRQNA